jgi:hypothetical protein
MGDRDKEHRANEAKRLLGEPILNEALAAMERQALEEILAAKGKDADQARREAADRIKVIRGLKDHLQVAVMQDKQANRPSSIA